MLGTNPLAVIARMTRSAMLEVLGEDYIRTARAKGLPPFRVVGVHALRNALIPVVTVIGLQVGVLFTGAILTETIFSWPGVGKWLIEAINRRDYPVLQGGMLLLGVRRDAGQPAGRRHLRRHQPAHPPGDCATGPDMAQALAPIAANGTPPGPLREFWISFSANRGAVMGLAGRGCACCWWRCSRRWLAPHLPDQTNSARLPAGRRPGRRAARCSSCWAPTRSAATSCRA